MACIAWVSEGTSFDFTRMLTAAMTTAGLALPSMQPRVQNAKIVDNRPVHASGRGSGNATAYHIADLTKGAMRRLK